MNIYKESFGEIIFNEEVPCVIWKPTKYMGSDDFRKLMSTGVDFYAKKKKSISNLVWLNDSREMKIISKEDQKWLEDSVNMQVVETGLKYMAFVLPENIFGRMVVKTYINSTLSSKNIELTIKTFSDYNKAVAWLTESAGNIQV